MASPSRRQESFSRTTSDAGVGAPILARTSSFSQDRESQSQERGVEGADRGAGVEEGNRDSQEPILARTSSFSQERGEGPARTSSFSQERAEGPARTSSFSQERGVGGPEKDQGAGVEEANQDDEGSLSASSIERLLQHVEKRAADLSKDEQPAERLSKDGLGSLKTMGSKDSAEGDAFEMDPEGRGGSRKRVGTV